jgi:hypothetical protein
MKIRQKRNQRRINVESGWKKKRQRERERAKKKNYFWIIISEPFPAHSLTDPARIKTKLKKILASEVCFIHKVALKRKMEASQQVA